ncbi:hypothetical protein, partial [Serratia oryzae]|uniref:hypothetical protein n=1 Tax=Serratia oryzae TaxID=2034155 RepID=UPI001ABF6855
MRRSLPLPFFIVLTLGANWHTEHCTMAESARFGPRVLAVALRTYPAGRCANWVYGVDLLHVEFPS